MLLEIFRFDWIINLYLSRTISTVDENDIGPPKKKFFEYCDNTIGNIVPCKDNVLNHLC